MNRPDYLRLCNEFDSSKHTLCFKDARGDYRVSSTKDPLLLAGWETKEYFLRDKTCPHIVSFLAGTDKISWAMCDCDQCVKEREHSDPVGKLLEHIDDKETDIANLSAHIVEREKILVAKTVEADKYKLEIEEIIHTLEKAPKMTCGATRLHTVQFGAGYLNRLREVLE